MVGGILLLGIAIFGLMVLFGKGKPENYYQFLIWLIFAPVLLAIGYNHALWFYFGLSLWMQILSVLLIPFLTATILKLLFPKAKWLQALLTTIFQTLIYAFTLPFRFLWRAGQFFFQRERRPQRLNPYRPVVGGRPPLQNERRQINPRGNIFD
jgi:FlaA1/EpsC-like NDP-sugar epimerase